MRKKRHLLLVVLLFHILTARAHETDCRPDEGRLEAARVEAARVEEMQSEEVSFAVIGDFGVPGRPADDVARMVKGWSPDFIITVGDNNYDCGLDDTIDERIGKNYHDFIHPYRGSLGAGASSNKFFPSLGNHDWGNMCADTPPNRRSCPRISSQPYLDYFTLPGNERYYTFEKGPVRFFVLDSDCNEPDGRGPDSRQAAWLRNEMRGSNALWKIVYFHHPPYSSGDHGSEPVMQWDFKGWGATAVLTGHEHNYERLVIDGLVYFVNGLGGTTSIRRFRQTIRGSQMRYNCDYGAMLVKASREKIVFEFIARPRRTNPSERRVIDTYTIASSGRHSAGPTAAACLTPPPRPGRQ